MGQFDPNAIVVAQITDYIQTAALLSSGSIQIPPGTKRIEAMLCGGGGGGGTTNAGGGGFGGAQIFDIPVVGQEIAYVIGAGGTAGAIGGTTTVSINGEVYAAVGGGGHGNGGPGRLGGSGGGNVANGTGGPGAPPFTRMPLWSALDMATSNGARQGSFYAPGAGYLAAAVLGQGCLAAGGLAGVDAALGWGGGGGGQYINGTGGGGGPLGGCLYGGGGGGYGTAGLSLASVIMWGLTGFAGGAASTAGGGGGGMLAVGAAASGTTGGAGGLGGGGGGSGTVPGVGGNGFVMFRFYI